MKTNSLEEFGTRFVELLPRLLREITRYENNYVTKGKITVPQLLVLDCLSRCNQRQMHELAQSMSVSYSTATGMIDRLIKQGLVRRKRGAKDRRTVLVSITPKGAKILSEVFAQKREGMIQLFSRLSSEERSTYLDIIEKLVGSLSSVQLGKCGS